MAKALKKNSAHRSSEIRHRLENDPIFRQTTERMIAEILDDPDGNTNGSAEGHTLRFTGQLLKPHIDNLQIGIIDSYEVGNLRNFLIWHIGLRRMIEISIEAIHKDAIGQRMEGFSQCKERALAMDDEIEEPSGDDPDPDRDAHDPDLPRPSELFNDKEEVS